MALLRVFEFLLILVVILGLVTQVMIPFMAGGSIFPIFRKRAKVLGEIIDAQEQLEVQELIKKRDELLDLSRASNVGTVVSEAPIVDPAPAVVSK